MANSMGLREGVWVGQLLGNGVLIGASYLPASRACPVNEGTIDRALEWATMMMRKMKLLSR